MYMQLSLILVGAYLIGSVCFAILFARLFSARDPRQFGSGNPGASNMYRVAGRLPAALTLLGDMGKAFVPVYALNSMAYYDTALLAGLAIFIGHIFPVYHRFKGGKGVAVYLGIYLGAWQEAGVVILGVWLLLAALSNYASLGGIGGCVFACFLAFMQPSNTDLFVAVVIASLVIFRHRDNIKNMLRGREKVLFKKRR